MKTLQSAGICRPRSHIALLLLLLLCCATASRDDALDAETSDSVVRGLRSAAHTHPFNGPLSGTTQVSRYQKGKTNLDFTEARDSEWQWHQLGMCKSAPRSRQITMPAPHHSVFTGRMPFLPPNQQRQSTEGASTDISLPLSNLYIYNC